MPDTPEKMDPAHLTRLQLATVLTGTGIVTLTPQALRNWVESGCPRESDGSFNLLRVCAWLAKERAKTPHVPRPETEEEKAARIALLHERRLGAKQKRKIEARKLEEGFMPREEVDAEFGRMATEIRTAFLGLPARMAKVLDGKSEPERVALLDAEVRASLEALANGKEDEHAVEQ
jgi:hypothetical protein